MKLKAKFVNKSIRGSHIRYEFDVYMDDNPLYSASRYTYKMETKNRKAKMVLDKNNQPILELVNDICKIYIDAKEGTAPIAIKEDVEKQLLGLKHTLTRPVPKIEDAPDIEDIELDHVGSVSMEG